MVKSKEFVPRNIWRYRWGIVYTDVVINGFDSIYKSTTLCTLPQHVFFTQNCCYTMGQVGNQMVTPRGYRLRVPCIWGAHYSVRADNGGSPILPISACRLALKREVWVLRRAFTHKKRGLEREVSETIAFLYNGSETVWKRTGTPNVGIPS
jgi:hypothetical protein